MTVVLAAAGYPGPPRAGDLLTGADRPGVLHAGTRRREDGAVVASGGRVVSVVGTGDTLEAAREAAYGRLAGVHLAGGHHRSDIALAAVRGAVAAAWNAGAGPFRVVGVTDGRRPGNGTSRRTWTGAAVRLRTTAYLLCGDWHAAEDLAQATLTKLYLAWRRIDRTGSVDAYARRVLLRTYLDERRRPWRRERPAADPPDRTSASTPRARWTSGWPWRRRCAGCRGRSGRPSCCATGVTWTSGETAAALGVSEGTVKSASSRGLAALREVLQGSRPQPAPTREVTS